MLKNMRSSPQNILIATYFCNPDFKYWVFDCSFLVKALSLNVIITKDINMNDKKQDQQFFDNLGKIIIFDSLASFLGFSSFEVTVQLK